MNKEISVGLNVVRIIACFMVILLHSASMGLTKLNDSWPGLNVIESLTRVCVPLFIMLSGALLIKEEPDSAIKVIKRIIRIAICLSFWTIAYIIIDKIPITAILHGPVKYHLWYLYAVVGFYLTIPIISKAYTSSSNLQIAYYVALWFTLCSLEFLKNSIGIENHVLDVFYISQFGNILGYLLIGKIAFDALCKNKLKLKQSLLIGVFLVSFVITSVITYILSIGSSDIVLTPYVYTSPFVIVGSVAIFLMSKKIGSVFYNHQKKINSIAGLTLGIYCVHVMVLEFLNEKLIDSGLFSITAGYVILTSILIFFISMIISMILKKSKILSFAI